MSSDRPFIFYWKTWWYFFSPSFNPPDRYLCPWHWWCFPWQQRGVAYGHASVFFWHGSLNSSQSTFGTQAKSSKMKIKLCIFLAFVAICIAQQEKGISLFSVVTFPNDPCTSSISSGSTDYRIGTCRTSEWVWVPNDQDWQKFAFNCFFSENVRKRADQIKDHVLLGENTRWSSVIKKVFLLLIQFLCLVFM